MPQPPESVVFPKRQTFREALVEQRNIIGAVILRDLRTRFFNHGLGFLVVPLFPFVHFIALLLIFGAMGRGGGYGDDLYMFLGTGLVPTLTFMYVSRFMGISLLMNRPMLAYPIIGMLEIVFGRALLEIVGAIWMVVAIFAVFYALGRDPIPADPVQAFFAFGVTLLLSISIGLIVALISAVSEAMATVWAISLIVFYLTSGSLFVVGFLPEIAVQILSWNPVLHCTEWMRLAYYPGYPDQVLDKGYLLSVAFGALVLGLVAERVARYKLLSG